MSKWIRIVSLSFKNGEMTLIDRIWDKGLIKQTDPTNPRIPDANHTIPANCKLDLHCNDSLIPIEQTITLGMFDGDLQLMTNNRSIETPTYSEYEIIQIHVILGKSDSHPGLMSSGLFVFEGVEGVEAEENQTILPPGGFGFPDKFSSLLVSTWLPIVQSLQSKMASN
jgi:hypothetical protein